MNPAQEHPARPKPMITLTEEECPEIKDWDVGETYKFEVTAKQVSLDSGEGMTLGGEDKPQMTARFEVLDVKPAGGTEEEPEDEEDEEPEKPEDEMEKPEKPVNTRVVNAVRNKFQKGYMK
jgi:hypothetical protein